MQEKWLTYFIFITGLPILLQQVFNFTLEDWPDGTLGSELGSIWQFYVTASGVALGVLFLFLLIAGGFTSGLDKMRRLQRQKIIESGEYTLNRRQKKALLEKGTFPISINMGQSEVGLAQIPNDGRMMVFETHSREPESIDQEIKIWFDKHLEADIRVLPAPKSSRHAHWERVIEIA